MDITIKCLALWVAIGLVDSTQAAKCDDYQKVPPIFPEPKYFGSNYEAGLQIFVNTLKIPCNGFLVSWKFVPIQKKVAGLHLAVFRPVESGEDFPRNFTVVGQTHIDGLKTLENKWQTVRLPKSIPVREGDILGLYYDNYHTSWENVAVGVVSLKDPNLSRSPVSSFGPAKTLVIMRDSTEVSTGSVVDASNASVEERIAGLAAIFHPEIRNSSRCSVPLSLLDVQCERQVTRFSFNSDEKRCVKFHGCIRQDEDAGYSNNFETENACILNCAHHIKGGSNPFNNVHIMGGYMMRSSDMGERNAALARNPRCKSTLKSSDWNCSGSRVRRFTYNPFLNFCVSFDGCMPAEGDEHNNWESASQCNGECAVTRSKTSRK